MVDVYLSHPLAECFERLREISIFRFAAKYKYNKIVLIGILLLIVDKFQWFFIHSTY